MECFLPWTFFPNFGLSFVTMERLYIIKLYMLYFVFWSPTSLACKRHKIYIYHRWIQHEWCGSVSEVGQKTYHNTALPVQCFLVILKGRCGGCLSAQKPGSHHYHHQLVTKTYTYIFGFGVFSCDLLKVIFTHIFTRELFLFHRIEMMFVYVWLGFEINSFIKKKKQTSAMLKHLFYSDSNALSILRYVK